MRIAQVVYSCIPGKFRGGVPKAVFELARAQAAVGHEVEVFATTFNSSEETELRDGDEVCVEGVRIRYFAAASARWMRAPSMRDALLQEAGRFDVVHGHNTYLALNRYVAEVGRKRAVRTFYHSHGAMDPIIVSRGIVKQFRKRAYIAAIERGNLSSACGVIALTEHEREQLRYWGVRAPIHVLPNGVDIPDGVRSSVRKSRAKSESGPADAVEKRVVFVGRLVPKKAVHLLVEAFSRTLEHVPSARLVIAGDRGQDPGYIALIDSIIERRGIERFVEFTGFLDESAKHELLGSASVFSHATESEGMALAVLEAMAAGLPTIVSTECYMDRAVEVGAVAEVDLSVDSIAATLVSLLRDTQLASTIGEAAIRYAQAHHSWRGIADALARVYSEALPSGRNAAEC